MLYQAIGFLETFTIKDEKKISIGALIGSSYAILDEFHQSFISERSASILDILIDTLGFLFGILLVMIVIKIVKRK